MGTEREVCQVSLQHSSPAPILRSQSIPGFRMKLSLPLFVISVAAAQKLSLCRDRESHFTYKGQRYLFSGNSSYLSDQKAQLVKTGAKGAEVTAVTKSFGEAADWCKERCMSLVSLETEGEWFEIRRRMVKEKAPFIWTSGHICDSDERCSTTPELQPLLLNGWFWSGSGARIGTANKIQEGWTTNPWGTNGLCSRAGPACKAYPGHEGVRQPDNAEERLKELIKSDTVLGEKESCLALATGLWQDETVWNDIACYHEKQWICEDNEGLLKQVGLK